MKSTIRPQSLSTQSDYESDGSTDIDLEGALSTSYPVVAQTVESGSQSQSQSNRSCVMIALSITVTLLLCTVAMMAWALHLNSLSLPLTSNASAPSDNSALPVAVSRLSELNSTDAQLPASELATFNAIFGTLDADDDSYLDESEFTLYFTLQLETWRIFDRMDANLDDTLSYSEAVTYTHAINSIPAAHVHIISSITRQLVVQYHFEPDDDTSLLFSEYIAFFLYFEAYDPTLSGFITKDTFSSTAARQQFAATDADNDSQISSQELLDMLFNTNKLLSIFDTPQAITATMNALNSIHISADMVAKVADQLQLSPWKIHHLRISGYSNELSASRHYICSPSASYCYYAFYGADAIDTTHVWQPRDSDSDAGTVVAEGIFVDDVETASSAEQAIILEAEAKCESKHCCRSGGSALSQEFEGSEGSDGVMCGARQYVECLSSSNACVWDCKPGLPGYTAIFRGIDRQNAVGLEHPQASKDEEDKVVDEDYDRYMLDRASLSVVDSCGTQYEYRPILASSSIHPSHAETHADESADTGSRRRRRRRRRMSVAGDMSERVRRKLGVMGADDRSEITWNESPYNKNVLLIYESSTGWHRCSGALVSPRHVLTAGHCVSDGKGNFYKSFRSYPAYGAGNRNTYFTHEDVQTFRGWHTGGDWDWDIGIITLDTDDTGFGWFQFGFNDGVIKNDVFGVDGYPGDKGLVLQHQLVKMDYDILEHLFRTETGDIVGGNSGGPAYMNDTEIVHGIVSHETYSRFTPKVYYHNAFARITESKYDALCSYMTQFVDIDNFC